MNLFLNITEIINGDKITQTTYNGDKDYMHEHDISYACMHNGD